MNRWDWLLSIGDALTWLSSPAPRAWLVLVIVVLCYATIKVLRSSQSILPNQPARYLRLMNSVMESRPWHFFLYMAALIVAVTAAGTVSNLIDHALSRRIHQDASDVSDALRQRATAHLLHRCKEIKRSIDSSQSSEWPREMVRRTPDKDTGAFVDPGGVRILGSSWEVSQKDDGPTLVIGLKALWDPKTRVTKLNKLDVYVKEARKKHKSGKPFDAKAFLTADKMNKEMMDLREKFDEVAKEYPGLIPDREVDWEKSAARKLYRWFGKLDPEENTKDEQRWDTAKLDELALLFEPVAADWKQMRMRRDVVEFFRVGWLGESDGLLSALEEVYGKPLPEMRVPPKVVQDLRESDPDWEKTYREMRVAAAEDTWRRLGRPFEEPNAEMVTRALQGHVTRLKKQGFQDRLIYKVLALALDSDDAPVPVNSELGGVTAEKAVATKLAERINRELITAIEKKSSGTEPFIGEFTNIRLRAILRGPIQLLIFAVFFFGILILLGQGYFADLWIQRGYGGWFAEFCNDRPDKFDLKWGNVLALPSENSTSDPLLRQVLASTGRGRDLFPRMLRGALQALIDGANREAACEAANKAGAEWLQARDKHYALFDFIEYALPALGMIGTLIGIGQGLSFGQQGASLSLQSKPRESGR